MKPYFNDLVVHKGYAFGFDGGILSCIDLKDGKFGRTDAAGVQRLVDGLSAAHPDSAARVSAAMPLFDALFASFGGRLPGTRPARSRK